MAVLQDININVHGQPSEKRLQTFLRLSQNENGRLISFRVLGPPLPSNCTATFSGTKPDGNVYSKTGTVTGNFVIIEEDIQMTAVAGVWDAKLDIINGTHNIMTALIRVVVDADVVDPDAIASDSQLQGLVAETKYYAEHARTDAYGSPLTAPTKAQMTDHTRVYVYTGSEPNMVAGNWYHWNGTAWVSGGVYNAVAVQTDTTLRVAGKAADGKATGDALDALKEDLYNIKKYYYDAGNPLTATITTTGWKIKSDGYSEADASYKLSKYPVTAGTVLKFVSDGNCQFQTSQSSPPSGTITRVGGTYGAGTHYEIVPDTATFLVISALVDGSQASVNTAEPIIPKLQTLFDLTDPVFVDGYTIDYTNGNINAEANNSYCTLDVSLFVGGNIKGRTGLAPNVAYGIAFYDAFDNYISGAHSTNTGHYEYDYDLTVPKNAKYVRITLRKASASLWKPVEYPWDVAFDNIQKSLPIYDVSLEQEVSEINENARHIKGNAGKALTLLHFSDLHGDKLALARISAYAEKISDSIDDIICTGDMVSNTYGQISSWWNEDVLTCVGNHDTASYSNGAYNWTALSMADRDDYYIAPFESNWGIIHTSGTSYYYKDYSTQKVRLIVMDGMLYTNAGAEATAQTAWLSSLLADAITNNMHVLIAIHAPHGGATAEQCSFSKYGQTAMPTYSDCNTPQTVIDAVASAIASGLHFIGYIVGHTHQDNIWDAENDGKQMMYCVTCAAKKDENQWKNSDQDRTKSDAFNIVTIDTTNTLVKIVRGGGADIDDHMRTRKAICFDYSTGQKVGEVL